MKKGFILSFVVFLTLGACTKSEEKKLIIERENLDNQVQNIVRNNLKDGESAKFRNHHELCGEVNAKNSFGAYSGFTKYVVTKERVYFENQFEDEMGRTIFIDLWNTECKGHKISLNNRSNEIAIDAEVEAH